ncbi:hypothetical protein PROFUN_14802 [Planoprotostelium fungivorum]|uniref:Uncharacterized protein n=1 Tax=Planoprotostelium fungivorum TaxID=1890364 RepID=A0A2P6MYS3_9EUKA|nr:hypothetical protein PROFUN_14802 [Planoprotostelium fungivorum]
MRSIIVVTLCLCVGIQAGGIDWAHLNATTLSELPPSVFQNVTKEDIAVIPQDAIIGLSPIQMWSLNAPSAAGFNQFQIANLNDSTCALISKDVIPFIIPPAFFGMQGPCLGRLPYEAFSSINASQFEYILEEAFKDVSGGQMSYMNVQNPTAIAGFNARDISKLDPFVCTTFGPIMIQSIRPNAFSGIYADCQRNIPPPSLSFITKDQVNQLPTMDFTAEQYAHFNPSAAAGITPFLMSTIVYDCQEISPEFVSNLQPDTLGRLTEGCANGLPDDAFMLLTAAQMPQLSFEIIRPIQLYYMNPLAGSNFTTEQARLMRSQPEFCGYMNSSLFLSLIPSPAWTSLFQPRYSYRGCVYAIPPSIFSGFSLRHLEATPDCSAFRASQINYWPPNIFSSINETCMGSPLSLEDLTGYQVKNMSPSQFPWLSAHQVQSFPLVTLSNCSLPQLYKLSVDGISGLNSDALVTLVAQYGADFLNLYTADQFPAKLWAPGGYPSNTIHEFKSFFVRDGAGSKLTNWQQLIDSGAPIACASVPFGSVTAEQMRNLTALSITGFQTWSVPGITNLAISVMSTSQASLLPKDFFTAMSGAQVQSMTTTVFSSLNYRLYVPSNSDNKVAVIPQEAYSDFSWCTVKLSDKQKILMTQRQKDLSNCDQKIGSDTEDGDKNTGWYSPPLVYGLGSVMVLGVAAVIVTVVVHFVRKSRRMKYEQV